MFPRRSPLVRTPIPLLRRSYSSGPLGIFRKHKSVPADNPIKASVPSVHHTDSARDHCPRLKLSTACAARPKREKRRQRIFPEGVEWGEIRGDTAGDDAYIVGKYYLGMFFGYEIDIGVADGVGAWNTKELGRPGLWSRLLMHYWALECEERMKLWKVDRAIQNTTGSGSVTFINEDEVNVIEMLHRAYLRTSIETDTTGGWLGSTTACVALLQRSTLHIANVRFFALSVTHSSSVIHERS
jgi:hypothetical protein